MSRHFTVEEANELLPMLRVELDKLRSIQTEFNRSYRAHHAMNKLTVQEGKLFELETKIEFLQMEASLHIQNIQQTGAQLKDIDTGLIDFPAMIDGEEVLLCWKTDEPAVVHYHRVEDGFAGRRPI